MGEQNSFFSFFLLLLLDVALVFNNLSHHMSDLLDEGQSRKGWKASEEPEKVEKKEKGDKKAKPAVAASLAAKVRSRFTLLWLLALGR